MSRVVMNRDGIAQLAKDEGVAAELGKVAEKVEAVAEIPSWLTSDTRYGVGPRGAFSQVMMIGQGALTVEFGSKSRAPRAPLRRALGQVHGR